MTAGDQTRPRSSAHRGNDDTGRTAPTTHPPCPQAQGQRNRRQRPSPGHTQPPAPVGTAPPGHHGTPPGLEQLPGTTHIILVPQRGQGHRRPGPGDGTTDARNLPRRRGWSRASSGTPRTPISPSTSTPMRALPASPCTERPTPRHSIPGTPQNTSPATSPIPRRSDHNGQPHPRPLVTPEGGLRLLNTVHSRTDSRTQPRQPCGQPQQRAPHRKRPRHV